MPGPPKCTACKRKWRQHGTLCRACARAAGVPRALLPTLEKEAMLTKQRTENVAALRRAPAPPLERTLVIDGVEHVVTFDGSIR